jgi:hypothetical protein
MLGSTEAVGIALAFALLALAIAHVALVVGLARKGAYARALAALVVPPFAPFWGWRAGLRRATRVWLAALVLYTFLLVCCATLFATS